MGFDIRLIIQEYRFQKHVLLFNLKFRKMKTNNTFIMRMLWVAIILGLSVTGAFAQGSDEIPKGQFLDAYTKPQSYIKISDVYSADAAKLSAEWASNSFSLQTVNGNKLYATGRYAANAQLTATSPSITLPAVINNERLILQINQSYEVETKHDFISVRVKVDGITSDVEVYRKSGKTSLIEDYINLTAFAGKRVQLSFCLSSDASEEGNGWQVASIELYKGVKSLNETNAGKATKKAKSNSMLRAGSTSNHTLEILGINTEAFPDAIFVEFTVKDAGGNFVDDLDVSDFTLLDDYGERYGCQKILKTSETMKEAVDIVFLVDNSGSMYDDILKVNAAIGSLLSGLQGKCDAKVALLRYGGYPSCPDYATKATYQGKFFYSLENEKAEFLSQIWSQNVGTLWGYEPYYEVLNWAANQNFGYRQNTKKVFILIGDEKVNDGLNNKECDNSTPSALTQSGVANTLSQKGIQTFFIIDESFAYGEFNTIASQTGGLIEDIDALTYDDILNKFGQAITEKYIMRYCLDVDPATVDPNDHHTVTVTYNGDQSATDTQIYYPSKSPSIVRSVQTQDLDKVSQLEDVAVPIQVTVILNGNTLDYIDFYYKGYSEPVYHTVRSNLSNGTINATGDEVSFLFFVPASSVITPNVSYYFTASTYTETPAGDVYHTVSSPPDNQNVFAWTFPVLPNQAPSIENVTISEVKPCHPITICAEVTDYTQYLNANPILNYRINKTPSRFNEIEMLPCAPGSDTYCATIPEDEVQETDLEWYIVAEDNYGTKGWEGNPSNPNFINTTYQQDPSLGGHPLDIVVTNYANIQHNCQAMEETDVLAAYFINSCDDEQLAGIGVWDGFDQGFNFTVYGDSDPNDDYKDGFEDGNQIIFKLIRNGTDYRLTNNSLTFNSTTHYYRLSTAVGPGAPAITIKGNNIDIPHGNTSFATNNNTNFGSSNSPVTKRFRIVNDGCDVLAIKKIQVNNANFTVVNPLTSDVLRDPGEYYEFDITYEALADATATVTVSTNASPAQYKFDVRGSTVISDPCTGIMLFPNPTPNFIDPTLVIPVTDDNTYVYAVLLNTSSAIIQTIMYNPSTQAGTYYQSISTSGLPAGTYPIVIYRDNKQCNTLKLIIL